MSAGDPVAFPLPEFWIREPGLLHGQKPRLPVLIDPRHWAADGLESWILFGPGSDCRDIYRQRAVPVYPLAARGVADVHKGEISRGFGTVSDDFAYGDASLVDFAYTGARTCAFRIFVPSVQAGALFGTYSNGGSQTTSNYRVYIWSDGTIIWDYGDISGALPGRIQTPYPVGRWFNAVCVSEGAGGGFKAIYVDGKLAASAASSSGPLGGTAWFNNVFPIGKLVLSLASQIYFHGHISDWRSFKRALGAGEIQALQQDWWGALLPA